MSDSMYRYHNDFRRVFQTMRSQRSKNTESDLMSCSNITRRSYKKSFTKASQHIQDVHFQFDPRPLGQHRIVTLEFNESTYMQMFHSLSYLNPVASHSSLKSNTAETLPLANANTRRIASTFTSFSQKLLPQSLLLLLQASNQPTKDIPPVKDYLSQLH